MTSTRDASLRHVDAGTRAAVKEAIRSRRIPTDERIRTLAYLHARRGTKNRDSFLGSIAALPTFGIVLVRDQVPVLMGYFAVWAVLVTVAIVRYWPESRYVRLHKLVAVAAMRYGSVPPEVPAGGADLAGGERG